MDAFEEKWEKKLLSGDDEYWLNLPPRPPWNNSHQNSKLLPSCPTELGSAHSIVGELQVYPWPCVAKVKVICRVIPKKT